MNYQPSPILIIVFALIFILALTILTILFVIKSRKKLFEKELEKKSLEIAYQRSNTLAIIEAQENERKRIARDLHDEVSSKLIALSLNIHLLRSQKTPEADKDNIFNTVESINATAIESSRAIAHHLFPPILEKFGLTDAIEEMISDFNSSKQIEIGYEAKIDLTTLSKEDQLHIFRILQELINNSVKHGKACKIEITMTKNNGDNLLDYRDDGIGIAEAKLVEKKGLGFINIESRIDAIKGSYAIDFSNSKGFNINIRF